MEIPYQLVRRNFYRKYFLGTADDSLEPQVPFEKLNIKQRLAIETVEKFISKSESEQRADPLHMLLLGSAGVGKTAVISHVKKVLRSKQAKDGNFDFKILSYTGMASFNAGGSTIHSFFGIPAYKSYAEWVDQLNQPMNPFRNEIFQTLRFLIIDEISMCGKLLLSYIDKFLRKMNPDFSGQPFGSVSILFVGGHFQLPAIGKCCSKKKHDLW